MLRKKLKLTGANASTAPQEQQTELVSVHFATPFWKQFFDLECELNEQLKTLEPAATIKHIYNPLTYAAELHCAYLRKYLSGAKRLLFVGMNPGANGMAQTGIPFGNVTSVREYMQLEGTVEQPPNQHVKRPILGMQCKIEEPSGKRIWTLLLQLAGGSLDTFAQQCFLHNFCPLVFYDKDGKNITPNELKGEYKTHIRDVCLKTLDKEIALVNPEIIVAVGDYIYNVLKKSSHANNVIIYKLHHPSPRAVNNQNWAEKAERMLREHDLIKFISNEA